MVSAALPMRSAHCMANGIRLHYLDFNSEAAGTPILVLPGITSPAATWAFVARRLAEERRVVVPDIRGRGLSENRPGLGYGLDDYAGDAAGLIEAVGLGRAIVIGHSMGARIATRMAAATDLVTRLILVDPPLSGPGRASYPTPIESYLTAHAAASRGATIEEFRAFTPAWTEEQIALRLEWLPTCSIEAIVRTYENFHVEDIFADFPKLTCPTLLMYAKLARVVTPEAAAEVASLLRNGQVVGVKAGHMIPWDNLEDFLDVTWQFL